MERELNILVTGIAGTGKTTVATLVANYLRSIGFTGVQLELTDHEMAPCPTDVRKRTAALQDAGTRITVTERMTRRSGPVHFDSGE